MSAKFHGHFALSHHIKRRHLRVFRGFSKLLFNSEKAVVLLDALRAGRRARLDLAGVEGNGEVSDCRVGARQAWTYPGVGSELFLCFLTPPV